MQRDSGAAAVAHFQLEADDDDDFVGRDDLNELRVGLGLGELEADLRDSGPGFGEVGEGAVGEAFDEAPFDLGEGALRDEEVGAGAAEEAVDDGVDDEGGDFEAHLAVEGLGGVEVEAGGVGEGVDEFGEGELLDVGDGDFDDGAEVAGEGGAEVPGEAYEAGFEGAHLVFGDAFGTLEVVGADFDVGEALVAREDHGRSFSLTAPASTAARRASTSDWSSTSGIIR